MAVQGTPHDLSFGETPKPTADALAALIGPCKGLTKLAFRPSETPLHPIIYGCGHTEAVCAAVLEYLPTNVEPVIERILHHLTGLLELRFINGTPSSNHLLASIASSCPHLRVQLRFRYCRPSADLDTFVNTLSVAEMLHPSHCTPAALRPLASHLTRLSMSLEHGDAENLPVPWLSRLERLSLRGCQTFSTRLAHLLAANRATLQRLKLEFISLDAAPGLAPLMAALDALLLTHLMLNFQELPPEADITALPPALLGRLERFVLIDPDEFTVQRPLSIASGRLRSLDLACVGSVTVLTLDCPALVDMRLQVAEFLPRQFLGFSTPMTDLVSVTCWEEDPIRLRRLDDVQLTRLDLLPAVCMRLAD
ncbi:hypothetical protein PAPYR_520 [Paratrimastix pyriformis]|uniref:Uncharacterized protein n=1 Tax=Paratrimastix pyriformis TaxID=342808 RepID=A0ABQ8UUL8_9EUKA|nr:hypothetical protein PAPYR_520 [Paratrimastix pyriformis]